jgi:hypothetical protein
MLVPRGYLEMSVPNYQSTLPNILEQKNSFTLQKMPKITQMNIRLCELSTVKNKAFGIYRLAPHSCFSHTTPHTSLNNLPKTAFLTTYFGIDSIMSGLKWCNGSYKMHILAVAKFTEETYNPFNY